MEGIWSGIGFSSSRVLGVEVEVEGMGKTVAEYHPSISVLHMQS